jgi:hypothetical protein
MQVSEKNMLLEPIVQFRNRDPELERVRLRVLSIEPFREGERWCDVQWHTIEDEASGVKFVVTDEPRFQRAAQFWQDYQAHAWGVRYFIEGVLRTQVEGDREYIDLGLVDKECRCSSPFPPFL